MKNFLKLFGIIALAAIIGLSTVGCLDPNDTPEKPTVTVSPATATVTKGGTQQFTATVSGTNSSAQTVTWSIVQTNKNAGTTINSNGLLTVAAAENLTSLTVRATSTADTGKSGTATVTISGSVTGGTYTPPAQCEACSGTSCSCNVLFSLYVNTHIQGLSAGSVTSASLWNNVAGLQASGSPAFEIVANGSKKAVKISGTAGWHGVDLQNSHFNFQAGDVVTATVRVVSLTQSGNPEILFNGKPGEWGPIGANPAVTAGQTYTLTRTLNTANITDITGSNPAAIRLQMNNVSAYSIELYELKVIRPGSGITPPTVINIVAIQGITAPVTGALPVTVITETAQYTGTVSWNGNPSTFAASTVYTATITLTPKTGFTLQGVSVNFFTVAGTSTAASNSANSGIITAVFPQTQGISGTVNLNGTRQYHRITGTQTINLTGLSNSNIYLAYVNPSSSNVLSANMGSVTVNSINSTSAVIKPLFAQSVTSNQPVLKSGHPAATEFNSLPAAPNAGRRIQSIGSRSIMALTAYTEGQTKDFYGHEASTKSSYTLLAQGTYSNVWVQNNEITETQAREITAKFDIVYPAVTNIFGFENGGGPTGDGGMDGDKRIQILIYNEPGGSSIGYFHGKDFIPAEDYYGAGGTNEAEMIYMNGVYLNTDVYPPFNVVLVHELQHLIHYSRKQLPIISGGLGLSSPTWYNEMLSAMTEELIAPFLGYNEYYPRIDDYFHPLNASTESTLTRFLNNFDYGEKSTFSGYLLRNYGGANLAKAIMDNNTVGIPSITAALQQVNGAEVTFETVFERFIESIFFTNADEAPLGKTLNTFQDTSSVTINGSNYFIRGFDITEFDLIPGMHTTRPSRLLAYSFNYYIEENWQNVTGDFSITVTPPGGNGKVFLIVR
jgi:hypothetical protein